MKRLLSILLLTGSLVSADETAQPSSNRIDARDDSEAAQSKLGKMEFLDDSVPLKVGDKISIRIVEDKDKTLSLLVQDSGHVNFPHIGLLKAEGLTAKALACIARRELEKSYSKTATVIVAIEPHCKILGCPPGGPVFTIFGQVARQGRYDFAAGDKMTFSGAILRAGGFVNQRMPKSAKIIHNTAEGKKTIEIKLREFINEVMVKGDVSKDIVIQDGDVIVIPEPSPINF